MDQKVVLITGATSGLGLATVARFTEDPDWIIIAGYRKTSDTTDLFSYAKMHSFIRPMILDVTHPADQARVIEKIKKDYGRLDCLVNNAGFGFIGPIEDFSLSEMHEQFETNFFGSLTMTNASLPLMRDSGGGRVIMISSVNGRVTFPLYGMYAASKYAIEAAGEALAMEVAKFGITVSLIEPGMFQTNFWKNRRSPLLTDSKTSVYHDMTARYFEKLKKAKQSKMMNTGMCDPYRIAEAAYSIATAPHPGFRYPVGIGSRLFHLMDTITPKFIKFFFARRALGW